MSTLGRVDHISNDSPVTVLILDQGYNTHIPPVVAVSGAEAVCRALVAKKVCGATPWRNQREPFKRLYLNQPGIVR